MRKSMLLVAAAAFIGGFAQEAKAEGPPQAELHVWAGNKADDSGSIGLRSVEVAAWASRWDRIGVRYDNSLSQDNPTLARLGIEAEAYFLSYQHDFNGDFIAMGEVGMRELPGGAEQRIYKGEGVFLNDGRATKLGLQVSPTDTPTGDYTDTVAYVSHNFPVSEHWRLEPALFVSESGALGDREWRAAGYAEYNAPSGWQLGVGGGYGQVDSDLPAASGGVANAHARLSFPIQEQIQLHFQVRYEDAPLTSYSAGLVGVSIRLPRS